MKVWVTRDNDETNECNITLGSKPQLTAGEWFDCNGDEMTIGGHKAFKGRFGFTPRKGSCQQYELSLTKIKE